MNFITNQSTLVLFGLLAVAFGVILIFSFIIANQNRKLKELETPRYGFLGKPLALIAVVGFAASTAYLYVNPDISNIINTGGGDVSVSDNSAEVEILIKSSLINTQGNLYQFQMVPIISGFEWGASEKNEFNVVWEIVNTSTGIQRLYQNSLNLNFQSKITYKLSSGNNTIKAIVTFNGAEYVKQIDVFVN